MLHVCVCVCLDAVCAPEAQKDFSPTLQIQAHCTAPTSASSVLTQTVITWTQMKVLCLCFVYFSPFSINHVSLKTAFLACDPLI